MSANVEVLSSYRFFSFLIVGLFLPNLHVLVSILSLAPILTGEDSGQENSIRFFSHQM